MTDRRPDLPVSERLRCCVCGGGTAGAADYVQGGQR